MRSSSTHKRLFGWGGLLGLLPIVLLLREQHVPSAGPLASLGVILLAYGFCALVLACWQSILETLLLLSLITGIGLTFLYVTRERPWDTPRWVAWSCLCAAWYSPVMLRALVLAMGAQTEATKMETPPQPASAQVHRALDDSWYYFLKHQRAGRWLLLLLALGLLAGLGAWLLE